MFLFNISVAVPVSKKYSSKVYEHGNDIALTHFLKKRSFSGEVSRALPRIEVGNLTGNDIYDAFDCSD